MTEAVIVSTARTGLAKSWKGAFNMTHGATLGGHVVKAAIERAGIDPGEVEDVVMGCANPEGATGVNIARQIAIRGGLPGDRPGHDREPLLLVGTADHRARRAAHHRRRGRGIVAGGVESISCVQNESNRHMVAEGWLKQNKPEIYWPMLQTAETVAKRYGIPREKQDEYGARSQQRAPRGRGGQVQRRDRADDDHMGVVDPPRAASSRARSRSRRRGHPRRHDATRACRRSRPRCPAA
jgi:acetyl-CoA C-acetyltransferase